MIPPHQTTRRPPIQSPRSPPCRPIAASASSCSSSSRARTGKQHLIEVCRGRIVKAGRSVTNELVIHDELVSGTHFELLVQDQGIWLRDLNSRNGVYILGTRVREALLDMERCSASAAPASRSSARRRSACRCRTTGPLRRALRRQPDHARGFAELERIAALAERLPVFITGETGTGKELVARGLHDASARAAGPFVVLDCTALPRELAESQILGHVRGAFTGAVRDYAGSVRAGPRRDAVHRRARRAAARAAGQAAATDRAR
jgi:transcriptional regulator of acetoin/glycerol metabolism